MHLLIMNTKTNLSDCNSETRSSSLTQVVWIRGLMMLALSAFLIGVPNARGQVIADNFDDSDDSDWAPYEGSAGTRHISYPADPAGGKYYRIFMSGADSAQGQFTRGGSIRND